MLKPFQWISWACMHRYAGEQYIANEFKDLQLECEANGKYNHIITPTKLSNAEHLVEY